MQVRCKGVCRSARGGRLGHGVLCWVSLWCAGGSGRKCAWALLDRQPQYTGLTELQEGTCQGAGAATFSSWGSRYLYYVSIFCESKGTHERSKRLLRFRLFCSLVRRDRRGQGELGPGVGSFQLLWGQRARQELVLAAMLMNCEVRWEVGLLMGS